MLSRVNLSSSLTSEEYKKHLTAQQKKLRKLFSKHCAKNKKVILVFEGWDAAGKGGAIKRITECIDPRHYEVHSIAKPSDEEYARHYLWRFWRRMPHAGQMAVFDRSWYGRVLVERVEKFAEESEWQRGFYEINDFETQLADAGILILKFFMHISADEQLRRFEDRQKNPFKNWKITEEDWRNRDRWDDYLPAYDEMFKLTNSLHAPWHVIPANDKYFARVQALRMLNAALS